MDIYKLFRDLYGVDQPQGCTDDEIAAVKEVFGALPPVVEDFWRAVGRTQRLNYVQDTWCLPEHYKKWKWLTDSGYLILLNESQGVCQAGIRREDLSLPDPPVYTQMEDDDPWLLSAPTTSEFLEAALLYEGVWQLDHCPEEFYWLSKEDMAVLQARLTRHPAVLKEWLDMEITFYSNRPDNLVAVMGMRNDEYQCLYGGATEESYAALLEVMEGLGEPV